jgi:sec-independent protein translocase protein TatB
MLPDLSATHIMLLVVVALVVVGPKDLPGLLRKIGQFMARLRGMANEFRASFDEMARQSELDELRKEVEAMRAAAAKPVNALKDHVSNLMEESTVSLDQPAPVIPDPVEPQVSILPPAGKRASKAASAKPKTAKADGPKPAPKSKTSSAKGSPAKSAPKKAKPKPKAPPPSEPGA